MDLAAGRGACLSGKAESVRSQSGGTASSCHNRMTYGAKEVVDLLLRRALVLSSGHVTHLAAAWRRPQRAHAHASSPLERGLLDAAVQAEIACRSLLWLL